MARMFPEVFPFPDDPSKQAEAAVFTALRDRLPRAWVAFYSVKWVVDRPSGPVDGESDFVLAHPDHGLLAVEVKGGGVGYDGKRRSWFSIDRHRQRHDIRDPFEQAENGARALDQKLEKLPKWRGTDCKIGRMVVLPDVPVEGDLLLHARPEWVIDVRGMARIAERVLEIAAAWRPRRGWQTPPGTERIALLERLLAPTFELRLPLRDALAQGDARVVRLTEEQLQVVTLLGCQRRAYVMGTAGTGKTSLAVEKARRLAAAGLRTLLCCFNRPLAEHLQQAAGPEVVVDTFHAVCEAAARAHGVPLPPNTGDKPWDAPVFDTLLPAALLDAIERGYARFDAIVVDEAQDFSDAWLTTLALALVDPDQGTFFVFGDPGQSLFPRQGTLLAEFPRFPLSTNLRNSQAIHALAAKFGASPALACAGPPGRPIDWVVAAPADTLAAVEHQLHRLVFTERLSPSDVAVLVMRRGALPRDVRRISGIPVGSRSAGPGEVLIDTVHRFKGLDKLAVILILSPELSLPANDALVYIGLTRARGLLVVIGPEGPVRAVQRR
jgi:hypothetical protein